jgi:hypothetical protein
VLGIAALPAGILLGGAVLTIALLRKFTHAMEPRSRRALEEALRSMPPLEASVLKAPSLVEQQARSQLKALRRHLEPLRVSAADRVKLSGLLQVASAPFLVQEPAHIEQHLTALVAAKTVEGATAARRALLEGVRVAHRQTFARAVAQACSNAACQIGFSRIQMRTGRSGELRLLAENDLGQALVAEIHAGAGGDPSLAAEVVGVRDGSCRRIMDAFEKALAEQGVRYGPPRRQPTGGVCQLETAQEFVSKAPHSGGPRRTQRLNASRRQEVVVR